MRDTNHIIKIFTISANRSKKQTVDGNINIFYFTPCVKCDLTHASRAEIRIFTPRDIKFRTILVRKTFS